jgi:hypothetical protein
LKPSKLNVESLLLEIHGQIAGLDADEDFKQILLEDIDLATLCFKEKNILSVLNCLGVLAGQLQSRVILSQGHYLKSTLVPAFLPGQSQAGTGPTGAEFEAQVEDRPVTEKLLLCIHRLQQILIKLPVSMIGPTGATGPAGPMGPSGATGPGGTTIISTSSYPVPQSVAVKSGYIDYGTHIVTYGNPRRKK